MQCSAELVCYAVPPRLDGYHQFIAVRALPAATSNLFGDICDVVREESHLATGQEANELVLGAASMC